MEVACMHRQCDAEGEVMFEEYRRGRLVLGGLEYAFFDAGKFELFDCPETISEFLAEDDEAVPQGGAEGGDPSEMVAYRVYFFNWNCFLHMGVRDAQFSWTEPPRFNSWHILEVVTRLRMRLKENIAPGGNLDLTWRG